MQKDSNINITNNKVYTVLFKIKNGRCLGSGNIPAGVLKAGGPNLVDRISLLTAGNKSAYHWNGKTLTYCPYLKKVIERIPTVIEV